MAKRNIRIRSVTYEYDPQAAELWFAMIADAILNELRTNVDLDAHTHEEEVIDT